MKKILYLFIVMAFAVTGYGQIELLNEQFEAGPTYTQVGAPWVQYEYGSPVASGGFTGFAYDEGDPQVYTTYVVDNDASHFGTIGTYSLVHNDNSGDNDSWVVSEALTIPADALSAELSFQYVSRYTYASCHFYYAISSGSADPADGDFVEIELPDHNIVADGWAEITADLSSQIGNTVYVAFRYVGNYDSEFAVDDVVVSYMPGGAAGGDVCHLDCPGDMEITLQNGQCCWPAEYEARTEGCTPAYQTIQTAPPSISGFTEDFDVSTFPEWNPDLNNFLADFTANAHAGGFTLNGPGSVNTAAQYGISGIFSAIDMTNLPNEITLYGRDRFTAGCNVNGEGALWNFTMVNFVAPFDGTFTFDWDYHNHDIAAFWDPFSYKVDGDWTNTVDIIDGNGPLDQNGTFTLHMNAGVAITVYIQSDDYPCSAEVTMDNMSFEGDAITDGIVLASGPEVGTPICYGNTETVQLNLLQGGQVIDSCQFDITVHEVPDAVTALFCNPTLNVSVDGNCEALIGADMILEGGPYGCYDDYRVEIYTSMPAPPFNTTGDVTNPVGLGTYHVGIYDDETGNNCWSIITVVDKMPPTIECECPVGGEFVEGAVVPGSIAGAFTDKDLTAAIHKDCWDFGTGDQVPDHGDHYYDIYAINVSLDGDYAFEGSDGNKMLIGIFDAPFNAVSTCENMIDGMGGYVLGSSGLFYEEPSSGANLDNVASLEAGITYYVVVTDFDAGHLSGHSISITPPQGGEVTFAKAVYGADCEFAGCYIGGTNYDFPLPTVLDNCSAELTWTESVVDGEDCGTYIVTRNYTATDVAGMSVSCSSEYYFKGIDLSNMVWPVNYDGLPEHEAMLECDGELPTSDVTGVPSGYEDACNTIEVFEHDVVHYLSCGIKILRYWTVVDDCTGEVYEHTQVIRITDNTAPTFMAPVDILAKTDVYECAANFEVPPLEHLEDNCDSHPTWWVTTTAGEAVYEHGVWTVSGVPLGDYTLCYHAVDNCGNEAVACVNVTVYDGVPPIPVCEQFKQVSLTIMGSAKVAALDFDSGSFDNCNGPFFKVLRVNDNLRYDGGCSDLNSGRYDDDVYFCCEDVGDTVMVSLRVYDLDPGVGPVNPSRERPGAELGGHYNDCWSMVKVECKVPPVVECENITVDCDAVLDPEQDPSLYPSVRSVCGYELTYTDTRDGEVCGSSITRTWTAVGCEKSTQCRQTITLTSTVPFDPCSIVFPGDEQGDCPSTDFNNRRPTWDENPCNVVTAEIVSEDTFKFVDGACYKIVREWAVIDWCVYESNKGAEDNIDEISGRKLNCSGDNLVEDGYYRYTQILMLTDEFAPEITVEDACLATADCETAIGVTLTAEATDSCNVNEKFNWKYIITNMDTWETVQYSYNYIPRPAQGVQGTQDNLNGVKEATIKLMTKLAIGTYKVTWTVGDGCGNASSYVQTVEVADKKAPTPIMVDIATAAMTNGMVELKARTFDKGGCDYGCLSSFDNCTPKSGLYFTFDENIPHLWDQPEAWDNQLSQYGMYFFNPTTGARSNQASYLAGTADAWLPGLNTAQRAYLCSYEEGANETKIIKVYVWDQFALNAGCDDGNFDFANVAVNFNHCPGTNGYDLSGMVDDFSGMEMTAYLNGEPRAVETTESGAYAFNLGENTYTVEGYSNDEYLNGVTTLDLVLIQKHLLGVGDGLTDPMDLLAADANNDGQVKVSDIAVIRKVILGITDAFINNSWVAISEESGTRTATVDLTSDVTGVNFDALKIGDLNHDANSNLESRNAGVVNMMLDNVQISEGQEVEIPFYAADFSDVRGGQLTMNVSGLNVKEIKSGAMNITTSNYNVVNNNLVMSWDNAKGLNVTDGEVLFTLVVRATTDVNLRSVLQSNDSQVRAEAYRGSSLEVNKLAITYRNASYALYQNTPNPFVSTTTIGFDLPEASEYTLTVYDVTGKVIKAVSKSGEAGYNTEVLTQKEMNTSGVLYYRLESGDYTATKKMIIIK